MVKVCNFSQKAAELRTFPGVGGGGGLHCYQFLPERCSAFYA